MLKVKGVPMFYLPVLYYPTKEDDRATGFLIPTYGSSTLRGQSIHNAFFWAINRSQDATILHDWFSKTGQGVGAEYRYNFGGGDDGNFSAYMLDDQHAATYTRRRRRDSPLTASRSYEIRGGANQLLPGNLRARASVNYFSSIATVADVQHQHLRRVAQPARSYGGNVVGAWRTYSLNGTFDRSEYFYNADQLRRHRQLAARDVHAERAAALRDSPVYFSVSSEFVAPRPRRRRRRRRS